MTEYLARIHYTRRVWDQTEGQIVLRPFVEEYSDPNPDELIDLVSALIQEGMDFRVEFP